MNQATADNHDHDDGCAGWGAFFRSLQETWRLAQETLMAELLTRGCAPGGSEDIRDGACPALATHQDGSLEGVVHGCALSDDHAEDVGSDGGDHAAGVGAGQGDRDGEGIGHSGPPGVASGCNLRFSGEARFTFDGKLSLTKLFTSVAGPDEAAGTGSTTAPQTHSEVAA